MGIRRKRSRMQSAWMRLDEATRLSLLSSAAAKTRGLLLGDLQQLFGQLVPELEQDALAQLLPPARQGREAPFFGLVERMVLAREEDLSSDEAVTRARRIKKASPASIAPELEPLAVADLMRLRLVLLSSFVHTVLGNLSRRLTTSLLDWATFFSHLTMAAFFLLAAYLNFNDPDWAIWCSIYIVGAALTVMGERLPPWPALLYGSACFLAALALPPFFLRVTSNWIDLVRTEEAREKFGLLLIALQMFYLTAPVWVKRFNLALLVLIAFAVGTFSVFGAIFLPGYLQSIDVYLPDHCRDSL
jgi:hypothetical protein